MAGDITEALGRLQGGAPGALDELLASSYDELCRLARSRLWASHLEHPLATESLVHESYLRLVNLKGLDLPDRKRYFAYAGKVMRSVILDGLRAQQAQCRGAGAERVTLNSQALADIGTDRDVEAVDQALQSLQRLHPDLAALVEMRYFGGLTDAEVAEALDISERTVRREWAKARAILLVLLEDR